jgi:hypothetical protein
MLLAAPDRCVARSDLVTLDVGGEFLELAGVLAGVVGAEQQFSTRGQDCPDASGGAAPVTTVGSGQLGAGERARHGFSLRPGSVSYDRTGSNRLWHLTGSTRQR